MKTVEIVRLLAGDGAVVELRAVGDHGSIESSS